MLRKTLDYWPLSRPYLLVTGIGLLLFYPTWLRLIDRWLTFDQVLAHGLITAIIFLALVVIHPPRNLAQQSDGSPQKTSWLSGAVFLVVVLVWGVMELVRIDTLAFLMLPIGLGTLAWVTLGAQAARQFIPYLFLLSLSLPVWADFVPYLVQLASLVVNQTVHWFGMTVLVEGNSISLPYGRLIIADGCSGIRYFAISILLGTMVSILNDSKLKGWTINLAAAALLGLMANWVRITILIVVAFESHMQNDLLHDHEAMGWMVFAAFALPALYFSPVRRRTHSDACNTAPGLQRRGIIVTVAALLIGPFAIGMANSINHSGPAWTLKDPRFLMSQAESLPIRMEYPERFKHSVWEISGTWVSVAQSVKHSNDEKLVPYFHPPINNSAWHLEKTLEHGLSIYRNLFSRKQVVVWRWYQLGSYQTDSYRKAKLLQIPATLKGYRRFAVITLQRSCVDRECESELAKLKTTKPKISLQDLRAEATQTMADSFRTTNQGLQ